MNWSGWRLVGACSAALLLMTAALLGIYGAGEEGVRVVVRATARTSVVIFVLAFSASSLRVLWRLPVTKWLMVNRRYVGVSFAASHTLHLLSLVWLYQISSEFRETLNLVTIIGGGGAYVIMYLMTLTSSDRAIALLGNRPWKALHKTGMYYIWIIFFQSYVPRAVTNPNYIPVALLLVAGIGLRIGAYSSVRRARGSKAVTRAAA